ncbi:type VII secretion integral membrane protein EccD [Actinospica robiniae]|uniref:type VII secretion integral membrane protein EccD n=1 Tax=Actinospica robiniae TaxID=304901 RepID=UPI0003FF3875|nr:type VII secretion integral membrane protein EccD [Actinospica robiniae]
MAANVMTGFCRITVVAPDVRVDVALPEDVPLAELLPDILRMADQWQNEGAHSGFAMARLDGGELDTGLSLSAQGVRNGDLLYLRAATETLPPPVYDDVVDAIVRSVADDKRMWSAPHFRRLGLIGGSMMLAVGAWVLWTSADPHGMPAAVAAILAVLLTVSGGVCSRSYKDHVGGAVLGGCAVPYAFLAGLGVLSLSQTAGLGRSHFLVACAAVLVVAVIGGVVQEEHDEVYLAAGIAGTIGALTAAVGLATHADPVKLAAGAGTVAVAAIGFLPGLAMRLVRFPMPQLIDGAPQVGPGGQQQRATLPAGNDDPVDTEAMARRTRRGHELLTGLVAACALVTVVCALTLSFTTLHSGGGAWAQGMAGILGLVLVSRARLLRRTPQVTALIGGGVITETILLVGATLQLSATARQTWYFAVVLAVGLLLLLVGYALPGRSLSPRWARTVDMLDALLLASVIPVLLGVLAVYNTVQSVGH